MEYENKNRRLEGYNYSEAGIYFITINVKNRENVFGKILNNKMILNEYGKIAESCWKEIPIHYGYCALDEFCVMPNHIHGIVLLKNGYDSSLEESRNIQKIPSAIGGFKSAVTKNINLKCEVFFQWQRSYHDRIIRNEEELNRIREYIIKNPYNWETDIEFTN